MQLGHLDSLRDIQNGLRNLSASKNHLNIAKVPSKSSLTYLNANRNADLFEDLYFDLLTQLEPSLKRQRQYAKRLKRKVFLMDSSIIPLCLSLFDWAKYRTSKGALKLHALLDYDLRLTGDTAQKAYPKKLRLVHVWDPERKAYLKIITNNLSWKADTVAELYKARWDIEVFFKNLKQLFRVKSFVGTSANAVRIQMWYAMIAMLLLRYLKNKAKYPWHLSNLITFLRLNLYSKISLEGWINKPFEEPEKPSTQTALF